MMNEEEGEVLNLKFEIRKEEAELVAVLFAVQNLEQDAPRTAWIRMIQLR
jgi:roadblock/LC7 domain-containing protein